MEPIRRLWDGMLLSSGGEGGWWSCAYGGNWVCSIWPGSEFRDSMITSGGLCKFLVDYYWGAHRNRHAIVFVAATGAASQEVRALGAK